MKKPGLLVPVVLAAALLGGSSVAEAKVFDLYAQAQGGGSYGMFLPGTVDHSTSATNPYQDFFKGSAGPAYGARIGAEFLFVDGWIEHMQYNSGSGLRTWTQFMVGADWDFPLGDAPEPGQKPKTFGEIGFAVGYGVGTGQQVMPPLDASELTDKGFLGQVSFGADYRFTKLLSIGLTVPISYGYLFKSCADCAANNEETQYQSISGAAFIHLRFHLELK